MPNPKRVIFLEGVDGAGKTTRAKKILGLGLDIRYFRSNFQVGSSFAGEPVDLEESLRYDWRILHDFISQTSDQNSILLVDRGFLSSYVYGKVLRNRDIGQLMREYLKMFRDLAEYWIFTREDSEMDEVEKEVNSQYIELEEYLINEGHDVRRFTRTRDSHFITNSFLDLEKEITSGHFDASYYNSLLARVKRGAFVVMSDLDGTILDANGSFITDTILKGIRKNAELIIVTGRERMDIDTGMEIVISVGERADMVRFIDNRMNLGLSSRVLKEYVLKVLKEKGCAVTVLDDRVDVMRHLFPEVTEFKELCPGILFRTTSDRCGISQ